MRRLSSQAGAALVTALMLTTLSLVVAMALLYAVTSGTGISASQKRYRSALAAAHGGVELVTQQIIPTLLQQNPDPATPLLTNLVHSFTPIGLQLPAFACLQQKLGTPTAAWSPECTAQANSELPDTPDLSFTLAGPPSQPGYSVTVKVVDTVPGNTDTAGFDLLDQGSSVAARDEGIRPRHLPSMFHISVQGVGGAPREKARLSLLYAY